jgi:hypothetical protein
VRQKLRRAAAKWIENYIRKRVGERGEGATGKLRGYSSAKPVWMPATRASMGDKKPTKIPARPTMRTVVDASTSKSKITGWAKRRTKGRKGFARFEGGYEEYRQKAGLQTGLFTLSNLGRLWRDWTSDAPSATGAAVVGFGTEVNTIAADAAEDRGRDDMFDLNDREIAHLGDHLGDILADYLAKELARRTGTPWRAGS